jgi:hypothetical protein
MPFFSVSDVKAEHQMRFFGNIRLISIEEV